MKNLLALKNFSVYLENKSILHNVNLTLAGGEIHALMGPNGSGKSTLTLALAGHPKYTVTKQTKAAINGRSLLKLKPEDRAKLGLFIGFQQPIAVPGVRVLNLLRLAKNNLEKSSGRQKPSSILEFKKKLTDDAHTLGLEEEFLKRYLNDGFSGGEKKKMEMLQALILKPKFAVFDEIDTGLDIDALKTVATAINILAGQGCGVLIITHYQRILRYLKPKKIHLLIQGQIARVGDAKLALKLEKEGYQHFLGNSK